jgi:hypothetical protein
MDGHNKSNDKGGNSHQDQRFITKNKYLFYNLLEFKRRLEQESEKFPGKN